MRCDLFNVGCHVQMAIYQFWSDIGLLNKLLIIAGIVGLIVSASMGILRIVKQFGGWPGIIAALALILGVVLALLPKRPRGDDFTGEVSGPDATGPFRFGVDRKKVKTKRPGPAKPWERQPGENAAEWQERLSKTK